MSVTISSRAELAEWMPKIRAANKAALRDPATLARYLDGSFVIRPHVRRIAEEMRNVLDGRVKRLLVTLPPQVGKSQLAAVWAPFWWLCNRPSDRIIIASYSQSLAMTRGRATRRMVRQHGWRYGLEMAPAATVTQDWENTRGGGILSIGVGGSITGRSADVIYADDLVKSRAEADSATIRDKLSDWWSADALSRLAPGAPVILIGTLWHPDDQYARVLEHDGTEDQGGPWRVLRIPAFADSPDDPLGRSIGDPLPHPRIPVDDHDQLLEHWNTRKAQTAARDWTALYQCDPRPTEGRLVSAETWRNRRHRSMPATATKTAVAVDPSGRDGRDLAGIVAGTLADDGRLYLTHDRSVAAGSDTWSRDAARLAAEVDAEYVIVESNYGGDMTRLALRTAWDTLAREHPDNPAYQRVPPQVKTVNARKGKLLRAEPAAQQIIEDRVRILHGLAELESEWETWVPTDPYSPGRIDASTYLVLSLLGAPGDDYQVATVAGISRSDIAQQHNPGSGVRIRRPNRRPT